MRLELVLLGLLAFGCIGSEGGVTDVGGNVTYAHLKPFYDAGCVNATASSLSCDNVSFAKEFSCSGNLVRIRNESIGLDPELVLAECDTFAYTENLTEAQMKDYFYCRGGLGYACISYIMWDGSKFVAIKNSDELARRIKPISSEKEALNYVLLSKNVQSLVERDLLPPLRSSAKKDNGGFMVTAYSVNPFGCYSKLDYYEVRYLVSREGKITELGRNVAYTRELGHMICVD